MGNIFNAAESLGGGYGGSIVSTAAATLVITILSVLLAIAATVLAFIFIVPNKKREKLNKFGKFLHDTVNFKYLIVEKILQALYIFATAFAIIDGVLSIFTTGLLGLLTSIIMPILLRLVYELLMLAIIAVKNIIQINNKLKSNSDHEEKDIFAAPDIKDILPEKKDETPAE